MRNNLIILAAALAGIICLSSTLLLSQTKSNPDSIRTDGVYSFYDTLKDNDGIESYKKFIYISPILFLENSKFIQSPYLWPNPNLIEVIKDDDKIPDHGNYYLDGDKITLEGAFTFITWGDVPRQYQAKFVGYLNQSKDTLYLKLGKPYPRRLKLKFNPRFKNGNYEMYIFKSLPKDDLKKIDEHFFEEATNKPATKRGWLWMIR